MIMFLKKSYLHGIAPFFYIRDSCLLISFQILQRDCFDPQLNKEVLMSKYLQCLLYLKVTYIGSFFI